MAEIDSSNRPQDPFRPESSVLGSSIPTSSISDYNYFTLNNTVYMTCAIHKVWD
jgi:hypothetical protein